MVKLQKPVLRVRVKQNQAVKSDRTFTSSSKVTFGPANTQDVCVTFEENGVLAHVDRKGNVFWKVHKGFAGEIHVAEQTLPILALIAGGMLQSGQSLVLTDDMNIKLEFGPNTVFLWKEMVEEVVYPKASVFKAWKETFPKDLFLAFCFSMVLHVIFGLTVNKIPSPQANLDELLENHYGKITVAEQNYIVQKIKEEQKQPTKKFKTNKLSQEAINAYSGFIAAVVTNAPKPKASGFSQLFSNVGLTQDLDKALAKNSVGELMAKQQGKSMLGQSNLEIDARLQNLGAKEMKTIATKDATLSGSASKVQVSNLSPAVDAGGGAMNQEALTQAVSVRAGQLQDCYSLALAKRSNVSGKLTLQILIGLEGTPEQVSIAQSSIQDQAFQNCIVSKARVWSFPKPQGGKVTVRFPFVFSSSNLKG